MTTALPLDVFPEEVGLLAERDPDRVELVIAFQGTAFSGKSMSGNALLR
jgi:hypothetical protein